MTRILLIGDDLPLLEGLAQTFAAMGLTPIVATSLRDGRELAVLNPPLITVVSRAFATESIAEMLGIPLIAGGALVLYGSAGQPTLSLPPVLQRAVLADLSLPLERNRLVALVHHVRDRARQTGRTSNETPAEQRGSPKGP